MIILKIYISTHNSRRIEIAKSVFEVNIEEDKRTNKPSGSLTLYRYSNNEINNERNYKLSSDLDPNIQKIRYFTDIYCTLLTPLNSLFYDVIGQQVRVKFR